MSATRVECLYCGHVLVAPEGASPGRVRALALEHDLACEANPLAIEVRRLRAKTEELGAALAPYAALARLSAGRVR